MDSLEGDIKSLSEAVHNARVALGRETNKTEDNVTDTFTSIQTKLASFMVDVRNASGEKVRLFQDDEITAMSSQADAIAKAVDIYKERDEKIKTLTASLKNLSPEERKETEASIATSQAYKDAAYAVLEYFNALDKLTVRALKQRTIVSRCSRKRSSFWNRYMPNSRNTRGICLPTRLSKRRGSISVIR